MYHLYKQKVQFLPRFVTYNLDFISQFYKQYLYKFYEQK